VALVRLATRSLICALCGCAAVDAPTVAVLP